jgi:hypothetical protein
MTDEAAHSNAPEQPRIVLRTAHWTVEHEVESDTYLLIDSADAYCADLHWDSRSECWADFLPYTAFSGPTTAADIEPLVALANLLRELPCPEGRATKDPHRARPSAAQH